MFFPHRVELLFASKNSFPVGYRDPQLTTLRNIRMYLYRRMHAPSSNCGWLTPDFSSASSGKSGRKTGQKTRCRKHYQYTVLSNAVGLIKTTSIETTVRKGNIRFSRVFSVVWYDTYVGNG